MTADRDDLDDILASVEQAREAINRVLTEELPAATPADGIGLLQFAETQTEEAIETLDDARIQHLPDDMVDMIQAVRGDLSQQLDSFRQLRAFLEQCEQAGVFDDTTVNEVAVEWFQDPEQARREFLDQ